MAATALRSPVPARLVLLMLCSWGSGSSASALNLLKTGGAETANSRVCSDHFITGCPNAVTDVNSEDWAPTVHPGYLKCNERPQTEEASCQRGERAKAQEVAANLDDVLCDEGSSIPDVGFSKEAMVPKAVYDDLKQKYSQLQAECDNLRVDIKKLKLASIKFLD